MYCSPLPVIFGVPKYAAAMMKICKERNIHVNLRQNLIEIKPDTKEAVFLKLDSEPEELVTLPVSLVHPVTIIWPHLEMKMQGST